MKTCYVSDKLINNNCDTIYDILFSTRVSLKVSFSKMPNTVNPLYNGTHYNSKILYNIIFIGTEWLYCSKYAYITTANSV